MNRYKITGVFLAWLVSGLLHTLVLSRYVDLGAGVLLAHALARSSIYFFLGILLNKIMTLSYFHKTLNYLISAVLTVGCWLTLGRLFDVLFLGEDANVLSQLTAVYALFGLALYVIVILIIIVQQGKYSADDPDEAFMETASDAVPLPVEGKSEVMEQVAVRTGSKIHVIAVADVYYLASDGDYVVIHTEHTKYMKEQTMKYFETCLPRSFIRIHRSCIVNTEKISRVELLERQTYYLILKNSVRLKMSIAGYRQLRQKLGL